MRLVSISRDREEILRREGRRIKEKIQPHFFTVALDQRGKFLTSEAFARLLETWIHSGRKDVAFLVGGPYGLEKVLQEKADFILSLSPMTWPHGIAKMLLLEQLYRAFTLLRGEPYHK